MIPQTAFTFDKERHTYELCGSQIPGVTEIINAMLPGWQADDFYLQRGTALHVACHLSDLNQLDIGTVDERIEGRLAAWQKFRIDFPCQILASEISICHEIYRYAGTIDRVLRTPSGKLIVCDIKSTIAPQVRIQLGFYSMLWHAKEGRTANMAVAVELGDDEKYRTMWMDERELRRAERVALGLLTVYGFALEHRLISQRRTNGNAETGNLAPA